LNAPGVSWAKAARGTKKRINKITGIAGII
jgi:hypothetical protein